MAQTSTTGLHLSRSKRTGIIVLIGLLILLLALWRLLPVWMTPAADPANAQLQAAWDQFKAEHTEQTGIDEKTTAGGQEQAHPGAGNTAALFVFDPNTASEQDLIQLGLATGTAKTLVKYRSKGGRFYKKEDLRKLYTLRPADYERIAPYVRIAGKEIYSHDYKESGDYKEKDRPVTANAPESIELNLADATALMRLKGIGPAFANRILNYRNALGGFERVEQLKEVYGLPDSTYRQISTKLKADAGYIKLINVNTATEEELARHPYIRKWLASDIIKLRRDLKSFTEITQIRQLPLINEEKYRKIAPYLSTH